MAREVLISNPSKILFPERGYTKLDLVQYYAAVADGAVRGVRDRPMALKRFVHGAAGEFFFQKRAPTPRPEWVRTVEIAFPSGRTAHEVERRAPSLATSKWWKEERRGVFLDYNQNAKDRTVASAYSVRPTPDARVSAPLRWDEVPDAELGDFTLATVPRRFVEMGDPSEAIDDHAYSLESLLELSARQAAEGHGEAPWPPYYPNAECQ